MSDEIMRRMELELDARRDEICTLRTQARTLAEAVIYSHQNSVPASAEAWQLAQAVLKEGH